MDIELYGKKLNLKAFSKHFENRRVWAAILSGLAAACLAMGKPEFVALITLTAGALGMHSYIKPKK